MHIPPSESSRARIRLHVIMPNDHIRQFYIMLKYYEKNEFKLRQIIIPDRLSMIGSHDAKKT